MPKAITQFEVFTLEDPARPGWTIQMATVPAGLPLNHEARHLLFDDRSVGVLYGMGSVWFTATAPSDVFVAQATFGGDGGKVRCCTIHVAPKFRRQGVATLLYRLASDAFAAPVVPSHLVSKDAVAFWGGRTEIWAQAKRGTR